MAHLARAIVKILVKFNSYTSMAADINFYGLVCGRVIRKISSTFSKVSICFHSFATLLILLILSGTDRQKTRIPAKEKAEEGAAKKRRSSLRKWSSHPCYESLESWVRISFTPSHSFSCRWDISSKSAL